MAQSAEELLDDGRNTENVTTYGMGYDLKRYSPLKQINTTNVKRLVPVWNATLSNLLGEQAQPLVYNGVMYVTNAAWTFAIDVATGRQIWRTEVGYDPGHAASRMLRRLEQGTGHLQRQTFPYDPRHARRRPRHEDGQAGVEGEVRRMEGRLFRHQSRHWWPTAC